MKFNKIIVSTNDDPTFYNFWELVYKSWKTFFPNVEVILAFITNRPENDPIVQHLKQWGTVKLYPEILNIPTPNLAKVVRLIEATKHGTDVCMVNDIDLVPLQSEYVYDRLSLREKDKLLLIGRLSEWGNLRGNKKYEEKSPMGYTVGESFIWKQVVNPHGYEYEELIKSWIDLYVFDVQEAINHPAADGYTPFGFCDESLMRALRSKTPDLVQIINLGFNPKVDGLDRCWWDKTDITRLYKNEYIEAHLPRPINKHLDKIKQIVDYIIKTSSERNITFEKKIMNTFGGSGIEKNVFDWIVKTLPKNSTVLELGMGKSSTINLASKFKLYSVEDQLKFYNLYSQYSDKAYYAPIKNGWYDLEVIKQIPQDYDLILIDGPNEEQPTTGLIDSTRGRFCEHLDLFNTDAIMVFHDTKPDWTAERELAEETARLLNLPLTFFDEGDYWGVVGKI